MQAKTRILLLLVTAVLVGSTSPHASKIVPEPTSATLKERAVSYYVALAKGDFELVWTFFGAAMREDNPRTEYVEHLKKSLHTVKLLGSPKTWLVSTGKDKRPLGKVEVQVHFVLSDKNVVPLVHTTSWVWQEQERRLDWYLAADAIQELK